MKPRNILIMAWWGHAIAFGPHINNLNMDDHAKTAAWETLVKAQEHAEGASPVEQGLITALSASKDLIDQLPFELVRANPDYLDGSFWHVGRNDFFSHASR